jgi:hypothetical protein
MEEEITLFRADNKNNKTMPEEFCTSGLWTKQINGGDSLALEKYGWLKNIKAHIRPGKKLEKDLYHKSCFLSFTTKEDRAFEYLKGRQNRSYAPTQSLIKANGYIFIAKIKLADLIPKEKGVYEYNYFCNLKRDTKLVQQLPIEEALRIHLTSCKVCDQKQKTHSMILINSIEYLQEFYPNDPSLKKAIEFAEEDGEWLLMPTDPFEIGRTSQIPPSNFWSCELYLRDEKEI